MHPARISYVTYDHGYGKIHTKDNSTPCLDESKILAGGGRNKTITPISFSTTKPRSSACSTGISTSRTGSLSFNLPPTPVRSLFILTASSSSTWTPTFSSSLASLIPSGTQGVTTGILRSSYTLPPASIIGMVLGIIVFLFVLVILFVCRRRIQSRRRLCSRDVDDCSWWDFPSTSSKKSRFDIASFVGKTGSRIVRPPAEWQSRRLRDFRFTNKQPDAQVETQGQDMASSESTSGESWLPSQSYTVSSSLLPVPTYNPSPVVNPTGASKSRFIPSVLTSSDTILEYSLISAPPSDFKAPYTFTSRLPDELEARRESECVGGLRASCVKKDGERSMVPVECLGVKGRDRDESRERKWEEGNKGAESLPRRGSSLHHK